MGQHCPFATSPLPADTVTLRIQSGHPVPAVRVGIDLKALGQVEPVPWPCEPHAVALVVIAGPMTRLLVSICQRATSRTAMNARHTSSSVRTGTNW